MNGILSSYQILGLKFKAPPPENVNVFRDMALEDVIQVTGGHMGGP